MIELQNDDVAGLVRRIDRFIIEVQKDASADVATMSQFAIDRLLSYLEALEFFTDWVVGQPQLDLPETHPQNIVLDDAPPVIKTENEMTRDVASLLFRARGELVNAQSARLATGLISYDESRLRSITSKIRAFITQYVANVTPVDLPESSPAREATGPGLRGTSPRAIA